MSKKRNRRRQMAEINVVPYIDVMLVLLVIFMITAPLLSQGVKVDLPRADAKPLSTSQKEPIIVSIDRDGRYYLNIHNDQKAALSSSILLNKVAAELIVANRKGDRQTVLVKGDRNVDYGRVVQLMVLLQKAGIDKVGLMTEDIGE